ncbi:MAG: adenylyl-sulfate reductase subunit alpha [Deltaproteobacteria bacterium]|nr:adenylyl-sulfate reductase subunit alpha [Deltaproteobacteria bacterium]
MKKRFLATDILVAGGGTAGCYAAITAARRSPDIGILIVEKANVERSGCLAAGVNALNAYITEGQSVRDYLEFVRQDAEKIIRDDLVLTMAERFNETAADLERMGLVIQKDKNGNYAARGRHNIRINGENIKPILAAETRRHGNIRILNHVNLTELLTWDGRVIGAAGFSVTDETAYAIFARAVIMATGGAAGLYRPNNPGFSRHKMWYPPFNTGAGYAMGIRAGAEMTSFEMRFVAQRCKDTIAPTGTIALGAGAREINALGEIFETRYGLSTSGRAYGAANEVREGRGPCFLRTQGITPKQDNDLLKAYLNMAPAQTLKWIESGKLPSGYNVEVEGTEPYIVGGHTGSGYWVDTARRTTLPGLYAAGDVSGGAPKKFVTGALAEGAITAETALADLKVLPDVPELAFAEQANTVFAEYETHLAPLDKKTLFDISALEEAMQKIMDEYAGGIRTGYRYNENQLSVAEERIASLAGLVENLRAEDGDGLLRIYELTERLTVCRTLLAHMRERKETRWPGFGIHTGYPNVDEGQENYVNSKLTDGRIEVFRRELVGEDNYEHTH